MPAKNQTRPLREIAGEIISDWRSPSNYAAKPYMEAMCTLDRIDAHYYADSATSIVRYFLSNASSWRGDTARRIKAELKAML